MEAMQELGNLVHDVVNRKLEERVLEIAGKGLGRTTPDMIELLETAERLGNE